MTTPYDTLANQALAKCDVCDMTLGYNAYCNQKNKDYWVCADLDCQRLIRQKSLLAPEVFKTQLALAQQIVRQRRQQAAERHAYIAQVIAREKSEQLAIFTAYSDAADGSGVSLQQLVLPSGLHVLAPVPAERLANYQQHLETIIREALSETEPSGIANIANTGDHKAAQGLIENEALFSRQPRLQNISDRLCGLCKGGCCCAGEDHAYLSSTSIKNRLRQNPALTPDDILATYLEAVGEQTVAGACINQLQGGCGLPREWRADICNSYYCDSVKALQRAYSHAQPSTEDQNSAINLLVIQRANTNWSRFDKTKNNEIVAVSVLVDTGVDCEIVKRF